MRSSSSVSVATVRLRLAITGVVQGVGFRPAVARAAIERGVHGFVYNDAGSVHCELEGAPDAVADVVTAIRRRPPPMARIDGVTVTTIAPNGQPGFAIVDSRRNPGEQRRTLVPPDIAICADCLRELRAPGDRRYGHPFITCTNCGPRYTVITDLPYDRPSTTMAKFDMCVACAAEYHDPADRRFHAQTIACHDCGPTLSWSGPALGGRVEDPLAAAAGALDDGRIVAVKGIGGYHLACRADDAAAVAELRRRKNRPAKPFAVMVADLAAAGHIAMVNAAAAEQLSSPSAPIVLLPGCDGAVLAAVAPGLRDIGLMLAYSPVHHLLFDRLGPRPLVMTSANVGGSPIVFRDNDIDWIDGLADGILTHDRPIHVPCEDSVVALAGDGSVVPVRRSRGYAPLPVTVRGIRSQAVVLAAGGDLKTTFCLMSADGRAHLSSHLGDMADPRTQSCFESAYEHLAFMTGRRPDLIACDLHPSYATTKWALRQDRPIVRVQHHHAHAVSLLAEHDRLGTPIVAVAYDGTGYGTDGTVWGGELLAISEPSVFTRVGHVKPFALPGGDAAVRHPARIALDLLDRAGIDWDDRLPAVNAVGDAGIYILRQQLPRGIGCAQTSSMGRLFDAVASLIGVCQLVTYEGQAAVELEQVARGGRSVALDFGVDGGVLDPAPLIAGLVDGLRGGVEVADLAAGFHDAVIRATATAVTECARRADIGTVGLTGGVFVNRLLLDGLGKALTGNGFEVLTHAVLPCNDGGLALGQAVIAATSNSRQKGSGGCA
jgi:hydrogenase maturation protein HypF